MKRKLLAVLLAATMVLSLAACGASSTTDSSDKTSTEVSKEENSEASVSVDTTSVETPVDTPSGNIEVTGYSVNELVDIYATLIQDVERSVYLGAEPLNDMLYNLYAEANYMTMDEKDHLGFCFYDIDGDGKMEMIVGKDSQIFGIASYSGTGPYMLVGAGYRSMATIYENGTIVCEGSSGAMCYVYEFFSFDGVDINLEDFFYSEGDENFENIYYYHNKTGNWDAAEEDRITEDEFNIMTDIGLEAVDFSEMYIPIAEYKDRFCDVRNDFNEEELYPDNVVWVLTGTESIYGSFPASEKEIGQEITINSDLSLHFYRSYPNYEESCESDRPRCHCSWLF